MGEFTLTDDVQDGEGKLNPSIFLCLAHLQTPLKPLFPNLRRLRIINADHSLDYLRLFLSPSLETLEIIGLGEACRPTLLSFLSAAVIEVPDLSTLILGPGRLSRNVVDACMGFGHLKHLELVDVISEVDFRLLMDIGLLEHLETFVIHAQGVVYSPSRALIQAKDDERALVVAEEELRRQQIEKEKQEHQKRLEEEMKERQRKAILSTAGICSICRRRFKKVTSKTQCLSCSIEIDKQEIHMQEQKKAADRQERMKKKEERRAKETEEERQAREMRAREAEEMRAREAEERRARETEGEQWAREERRTRKKHMWEARRAEEERLAIEKEAEVLLKLEEEANYEAMCEALEKEEELWRIQGVSERNEPAEHEMKELQDGAEMGRRVIDVSLLVEMKDGIDGLDTTSLPEDNNGNGTQAAIDHHEEAMSPKFPKLLNVTVRGSAEMMQDVVQLITSASVAHLCLDMVPAQSEPSCIAPPPPRRFVDTVNSALRRWAGAMVHVTLSGLPNVVSKLPNETVEALVRLPHLEHIELNGWGVDLNIAEYFRRRLSDAGASKLKVLYLPDDNNAISIPLSELNSIAKACPNLLSLRCRLKNLLDTPGFPFSGFKILSHSLEILTIGDTNPPLDFDAILEVVQYIDNIFPNIKDIKPLEGMAQNAEQWRQIDKLVKLRQSGWLDRMRS